MCVLLHILDALIACVTVSNATYVVTTYKLILAPEVEWEIPETTIPEGENTEVCFTTDIGTAVPYQVEIGARVKGTNPATGKCFCVRAR